MPKRLVKILSDIIAEPFATAINNCLIQSLFPKNAKIALATLLNFKLHASKYLQ